MDTFKQITEKLKKFVIEPKSKEKIFFDDMEDETGLNIGECMTSAQMGPAPTPNIGSVVKGTTINGISVEGKSRKKNKKLKEDFYPEFTLSFFDANTDELIQDPIPYETEQGALYAYNKAKDSLYDFEYVELSKHVGEGAYEPIKNSSWFNESLMYKRNKQLRKVSESASDKYLRITYDGKEVDVYTITRFIGNIIPKNYDNSKLKAEIIDTQNL